MRTKTWGLVPPETPINETQYVKVGETYFEIIPEITHVGIKIFYVLFSGIDGIWPQTVLADRLLVYGCKRYCKINE